MAIDFSIPIYGGTVRLITSTEEYIEEADSDCDCECKGLAEMVPGETADGGNIYLVGIFDSSATTLVHELSHTALNVISRAGFSAHDGNGEPFSYLLDYFFQSATQLLKEAEGTIKWSI